QKAADTKPDIARRCRQSIPTVSLVLGGDLCHEGKVGGPEQALSNSDQQSHADNHGGIVHDKVAKETSPLKDLRGQHDTLCTKVIYQHSCHWHHRYGNDGSDAQSKPDGWQRQTHRSCEVKQREWQKESCPQEINECGYHKISRTSQMWRSEEHT